VCILRAEKDTSNQVAALFQFRIRTLFVVVAVVSVVAFGVSTLIGVKNTIRGSYAVWWVADMCIEHMEVNDGQWPRSWDDLRDDYQTCVARSGQPWSFEELSSQVEVDWHANPIELLPIVDDSSLDLKLIWLRNGSDAHWSGQEPNTKVVEYLKSLQLQRHSIHPWTSD